MAKPEKHILSKSTFMYGCQCPKRLWLHKHMPAVRDEIDEAQQAIFQKGTDVGMLARGLFPGGVDASPATTFEYQQSVANTAKYIAEGQTIIYEAAFQYEGLLCAVDILVKRRNKWYAYEVKSTTSVKDTYLLDAAFQYYVITRAGLSLADMYVTHLNNKYIRYGELDLKQLFISESVISSAQDKQLFIAEKAETLILVARQKNMPSIVVGNQCKVPYLCDFYGFCTKDIIDEEKDYGEPYINNEAIHSFINELEYPLYFIDFESWSTPVPEYDGQWPYRQVCFQYSVHLQSAPGSGVEYFAYLAENTGTPNLEFLENLLKVLGEKGTVLVYNISFEKTRLNELAREYPRYKMEIDAVVNRIVDLMVPFRKHYKLPEMKGSYSIKYVLPALIPELSYQHLEIGNGGDASAAFYNLNNETDSERVAETRLALLEYCGLDTLAMVSILNRLRELKR
ncbi:MAG: DUF2779 domain-containing protein [Flavobacterium sp.]|uniref:DUF2779 domain-containing protein n=1 Tax=Flavobacterium sp. TaxID=239 RepID=UPI003266863F